MSFANVHNYAPVEADTMTPTGDRILVQWEEKKGTLLGGKLLAAQTGRRQHYTGIVISVGPLVDPEINVGDRLIFDQFSSFEKFFDPKYGRLALIEEGKQGPCFAVIPKRLEDEDFKVSDLKIENGELDFDYSAA